MAFTFKLRCLSVSILLCLQMVKASHEVSNKEEPIEKAPFIQNINTIMNHKVTRMAKNALGVTKDYMVQYGEEFADKMNENHAKHPASPNALTPNLIKHNIFDPTKALTQVSLSKLKSFQSEVNEAYHELDKRDENEKRNAMSNVKRLASKPLTLGTATAEVLSNKAANFMKKISVDDNSKENKGKEKENKASTETEKPKKTTKKKKEEKNE